MKRLFIILLLLPIFSYCQELKLSFIQNINRMDLASVKELLVDGNGYYLIKENKYLHPKSIDESHAFMIEIEEKYFPLISKTVRQTEITCSEDLNINNFKSELIEDGYEYVGKSNLTTIDFVSYKKGKDNEVYIGKISSTGIVKYQIIFITRY